MSEFGLGKVDMEFLGECEGALGKILPKGTGSLDAGGGGTSSFQAQMNMRDSAPSGPSR